MRIAVIHVARLLKTDFQFIFVVCRADLRGRQKGFGQIRRRKHIPEKRQKEKNG